MINPCRHCDRRSAECHAHCEKYAAWAAEHRAAKERDHENRLADELAILNCLRIREKQRKGGK
jgi:hypothetical protein